VEESKEEVKEPTKEVEESKEEVKEPTKEVEESKEEVKEPTKEVEESKEEVKEPTKEVEEAKEEVKEPKGNNQVVENEGRTADTLNTQHVNKTEEGKKSLPSTGGEASTSTLLSGITLVLSALSMFVFRKRLFKK
ncbi:LPXTG cell wall anchor domain-containing protein, partial [Bacillus thuringiensis]